MWSKLLIDPPVLTRCLTGGWKFWEGTSKLITSVYLNPPPSHTHTQNWIFSSRTLTLRRLSGVPEGYGYCLVRNFGQKVLGLVRVATSPSLLLNWSLYFKYLLRPFYGPVKIEKKTVLSARFYLQNCTWGEGQPTDADAKNDTDNKWAKDTCWHFT